MFFIYIYFIVHVSPLECFRGIFVSLCCCFNLPFSCFRKFLPNTLTICAHVCQIVLCFEHLPNVYLLFVNIFLLFFVRLLSSSFYISLYYLLSLSLSLFLSFLFSHTRITQGSRKTQLFQSYHYCCNSDHYDCSWKQILS